MYIVFVLYSHCICIVFVLYCICIVIVLYLYCICICIVSILYSCCICIVFVLQLYCICIVFVLYLYCIYIVFVLYLYCVCIVFVLYLYCIVFRIVFFVSFFDFVLFAAKNLHAKYTTLLFFPWGSGGACRAMVERVGQILGTQVNITSPSLKRGLYCWLEYNFGIGKQLR